MRKCFVILPVAALVFIAAPASAQNKVVGAEKCAKVCHKIQFDSWSKTKHALAGEKGAQCETCHGPGSGYMTLSIMKDPAKAKAAGLIAHPDKAGCLRCHKDGVKDADMLTTHAHKPKA